MIEPPPPTPTGSFNPHRLEARLPECGDASPDRVLEGFLRYIDELKLTLYPAQEEAMMELATGTNVLLWTPTGSGKSLVALFVHFQGVASGKRTVYTSPIKALVNEKFLALCRDMGPERVGLITGDASVNRDAPILCCTAEILSNMALAEGAHADIGAVILDEFHYYADPDRGMHWQIPLLALPQCQFLLMSATFGDTLPFERALEKLTKRPTKTIRSHDRPVPLDFSYQEKATHEILNELLAQGKAPVYIVSFSQREALEEAQRLMSIDFMSKEEKRGITEAIAGVRFDSPFGKEFTRLLKHGVGLHHAGLLPKYRFTVEKLAQEGRLKVISGTDTLGVGVNIPIRTVLLTKLCKFDGDKTVLVKSRDFHQLSGRAGRRGFDTQGYVVALAPEHVVENQKLEAKAQAQPGKKKKFVARKPPDRGYVHWDRSTFEKIRTAAPEPLTSRFQVTPAMLLSVLSRPEGGCLSFGRLIRDCHERPAQKRILATQAKAHFSSLSSASIIARVGKRIEVHGDLQRDFSMHHALSLYLVETTSLLDTQSETYALDLLTLVEAIVETPDIILRQQVNKLKTERLGELKAQGVEYEERMAELEKVEAPRPNEQFLRETFAAFSQIHPWVTAHALAPKSIARDMFEKFMSFSEYVREYGLERAEGVLLRYLSSIYKTLTTNVPERAKTEGVYDLTEYFGIMVRQVDSSLIDEWERLKGLPERGPEALTAPVRKRLITDDVRGFTVLIRNLVFQLVRALAKGELDAALSLCAAPGLTRKELEVALNAYVEAFATIVTTSDARAPDLLQLEKEETRWKFTQALLDEEGATGAAIVGYVDLEASRAAEAVVLGLEGLPLD